MSRSRITKEMTDLFRYNPETGILIWNPRPPEHFSSIKSWKTWNTKYANRQAGVKLRSRSGLPAVIKVCINGIPYAAHQIIWNIMKGPIDDGFQVDHKDGNGWGNRWNNLRLATNSQNSMNRKPIEGTKSGFKGVVFIAKYNLWAARIMVKGKRIELGCHKDPLVAKAVYDEAAKRLHGEYARTS